MTDLPPPNQPTKIEVDRLSFDPANPRFTPDMDVDPRSEVDVIRELDQRSDLGELIQSIAASGYVDIEPLVIMEEGGKLLVLEGNRRLAALRLLRHPNLAAEVGVKLPQVDLSKAATFERVTVYRVMDRSAAQDFIGFKHINGPHRWDSLAKARFAAQWLEQEKRVEGGLSLRDIARRMGDRHDTIKRMVAGYLVLEQAERAKVFDAHDRYNSLGPLPFSHLYVGITRPPIRDFLGLPDEGRLDDPMPNPVPSDHIESLRQMMLWLFGSKRDDQPPIVTSQNPHIKQLSEVLGHSVARTMLMSGNPLKMALGQVEKPSEAFERAIASAHSQLEMAQQKLDSYDGSSVTMLEIAGAVRGKATLICDVMEVKAASYAKSQRAARKEKAGKA